MSFESPNTPESSEYLDVVMPNEVFRELMDYIDKIGRGEFSLNALFKDKDDYEAERITHERMLKHGLKSSLPPERIRKFFSDFYQGIIDAGYDGKSDQILVRWVSANSPDDVSSILESGKTNGGKIDDRIGVCMSPLGSKAGDTMAGNIINRRSGVLFVYDGRKLERLSEEEAKTKRWWRLQFDDTWWNRF
jgi:hypothetical protein